LHHLGLRRFDNLRTDLAARRLVLGSLVLGRVAEANLACQNSHVRLNNAWSTVLASRQQSILFATSRLRDLSPKSVLHRGYSVLIDEQGALVASVAKTRPGAAIRAIVEDGTIQGTVTSTVPIRQ
jgi:exonuclease VII large subunit